MDLAEEGPGDDGDFEKVTESEMKNANMLLDHMRFFFNIVWFPWDEREEEDMNDFYEMCDSTDENWVSMHLAFRIQAYKEHMQNQTDTFDQLRKLANEHDSLVQRQKNIAPYHDDDTNQDIQDLIVVEGLEIDDQLDNIKKRADRLENPSLYKAFQNVARFRKKEARNAMLSDYYGINQLAEKKAICFVLGKKVNMQGKSHELCYDASQYAYGNTMMYKLSDIGIIRLATLFSSKQTDLYHTLVENKLCLEEHKRV